MVMKMPNGKFQKENFKHKNLESRTNIYNPEFSSSVKATSDTQRRGFYENINKWVEFVAYMRFYPDYFWDLISNSSSQIKLDLDQRVFLRCIARFKHVYGVFPRGYGKTMLEVMGMIHACIFYPGITISMTAQTKENASKILKEKYLELIAAFPMLANEIRNTNFSKDRAEIIFQNNSTIDILANQQSTKGLRRRRLQIEESALINNALFEDVLEPIVNVARRTGKGNIDREELNGQINFFTTSGYRGSDEYKRSVKMTEEMLDLKGVMVIGSDWRLALKFGRGESEQTIMQKKESNSPISFAMNYLSEWVGAVDGALIAINKILNIRTLKEPELKGDGFSEYVLSMDVARSYNEDNADSSIVVLKLKRSKTGKLIQVHCVNIINLPTGLSIPNQALELKRIKKLYKPTAVIVDANGLGIGLVDNCMEETIDPETGENLGSWSLLNVEANKKYEEKNNRIYSDSEKILYAMNATGLNDEIIVNFKSMVESNKLLLLEQLSNNVYDVNDEESVRKKIIPHMQTDNLVAEISNLKIKNKESGKMVVEQVSRKINKDKYSALSYGLYWIKLNDFGVETDNNVKPENYFFC